MSKYITMVWAFLPIIHMTRIVQIPTRDNLAKRPFRLYVLSVS